MTKTNWEQLTNGNSRKNSKQLTSTCKCDQLLQNQSLRLEKLQLNSLQKWGLIA